MTKISKDADAMLRMKQLLLDAKRIGLEGTPAYNALARKYLNARKALGR